MEDLQERCQRLERALQQLLLAVMDAGKLVPELQGDGAVPTARGDVARGVDVRLDFHDALTRAAQELRFEDWS